jgi:transposase
MTASSGGAGQETATRLTNLALPCHGRQARGALLPLAVIYLGSPRTQVAAIGGVGLQTVRDWVLRVDARGPDGLLDGKAPGQPSILSDERRNWLSGVIENGPIPAVHGVVS